MAQSGNVGPRMASCAYALLSSPLSSGLPTPTIAPSGPELSPPLEAVLDTVTRLSEKYYLFQNGSVGRTRKASSGDNRPSNGP